MAQDPFVEEEGLMVNEEEALTDVSTDGRGRRGSAEWKLGDHSTAPIPRVVRDELRTLRRPRPASHG